MDSLNNNNETVQEEVSFSEIFFHYLSFWKWFLLSLFICVAVALVYLRYTTKEYVVTSKVLIKDEAKGQTPLDMNAFSDLGLTPNIGIFDNEIEVLGSKSLMREVIDSLGLGVSYYKEGKIKKVELYKKTPVYVTVTNQSASGWFVLDKSETEDGKYTIKDLDSDFSATFSFAEEVLSPWGVLSFAENPFSSTDYPIDVFIHSPLWMPQISISPLNKATTVVNVSTVTPVGEKGVDMINTLVAIYNKKAIDEKTLVARNTIEFITAREEDLFKDLQNAEQGVANYKISSGLTNIEAEASLFLSAQTEYSKQISDLEIQLNVLKQVKSYINDPHNIGNVAPANIGLTDQTILSLMKDYNEQIISKNAATLGLKAGNPVVKEYDDRIALLREEMIKGMNLLERSMQTKLRSLKEQEGIYLAKSLGLSNREKEAGELYRQKETKASLYVYLLQKKEETRLSLVMATPNALVIDAAEVYPVPVKPKSRIVLLAALLIGIIIPIVIVYIKDLFDNKLRNKEQLKKTVKAPFLGDIPQAQANSPFPVLNVRSGIAEKFRVVSSNLSFITPKNKDTANVIMVTSSFSGEGKSFFSRNLAMSLATTGHKALLIDLDMRKSVLNETLEMGQGKGIAMYLSDSSITFKDIVDSERCHKNLDIIPIKVFPPNPAELLVSDRLDSLFEEIKDKYDYIIVDTAPVGLVADAYRIVQYADATIYVTRVNHTYVQQLQDIQSIYKDNKLGHLTTVLNAVPKEGRYGYGYSYGYGSKKDNKYYNED
ncbi:tyrosine-protein kinase Etk/Wzc [Dysgonomonadaceae bacterium PH5-43]|nr:tyrosine-protein kinase Etk/Wzc [Dysgonomonadaceae bacterium PH5-43]